MKRLVALCFLFLLVAIPTAFADSSVTMEITINESVFVSFTFSDIELQLYNEAKGQGFNVSSIPKIIEDDFELRNLENARVIYDLAQEIFDDTARSIHVTFYLAGSDLISYQLNKTDMTRIFRVRTDWRRFEIDLTGNFSLNINKHFGVPLTEWQLVDYIDANGKVHAAYERSIEEGSIEMEFRFILPEKAFDIEAEEDTIVFNTPLAFEDSLVTSPFLILGIVIIVNIFFVVYRKARK